MYFICIIISRVHQSDDSSKVDFYIKNRNVSQVIILLHNLIKCVAYEDFTYISINIIHREKF